ncbi:hypothetical protein ACTL32_14125 [Planococcus sp. FY231025]|uniref:hypothetical protein n=1 Tax=Planococcus sp. FY231025 TaxID=3455699 RepID=UPI003F8EDC5F
MEEKRNEEAVETETINEEPKATEEPKAVEADTVEPEEIEEEPGEPDMDARLNKIYSNVASNRYENLRTSYIENKAKELRRRTK